MKTKADGTQYWNQDGELHRVDGPAIIYAADGSKEWYQNGKIHRVDGPAYIGTDGSQAWWIKGIQIDIDEWAKCHDVMAWPNWTAQDKMLFMLTFS